MKRNYMKALAAILLVCFLLGGSGVSLGSVAFASSTPARTGPLRLTIGTAGLGGNLYIVGATLAQVLTRHMPMTDFTPEVTGGSGVNVGLVQQKDVDFALCSNVAAYNGYNAKGWLEGHDPMLDVRTIAALMPSALELFTLASSNVYAIQDYEAKIISAATTGGGGDMTARDLFPTLGIQPAQIQGMTLPDVNSNLIDGLLDCAMDFGTFPHASRLELEASANIRFIELSPEERQLMVEVFPYYMEGIIPNGTYQSIPSDYHTIMAPNILITHKDSPEDFVYEMLTVIFENMDELISGSNSFSYVEMDYMLGTAIPLHPGAVRYFKEQGFTIPVHLIPEEYAE